MKNTKFNLIKALAFTSLLFSSVGLSDPISQKGFKSYKVSWVESYGQSCESTCGKVNATAESMSISSVGSQKISVCRVSAYHFNMYGTNTSDNCFYYDIDEERPVKEIDFE